MNISSFDGIVKGFWVAVLLFLGGCQNRTALEQSVLVGRIAMIDLKNFSGIDQGTEVRILLQKIGHPAAVAYNGHYVFIYKVVPYGNTLFVAIDADGSFDIKTARVVYWYVSNNQSKEFGIVTRDQLCRVRVGMNFGDMLVALGPPLRHSGSGMEIASYWVIGEGERGFGLTGEDLNSEVIGVPGDCR